MDPLDFLYHMYYEQVMLLISESRLPSSDEEKEAFIAVMHETQSYYEDNDPDNMLTQWKLAMQRAGKEDEIERALSLL